MLQLPPELWHEIILINEKERQKRWTIRKKKCHNVLSVIHISTNHLLNLNLYNKNWLKHNDYLQERGLPSWCYLFCSDDGNGYSAEIVLQKNDRILYTSEKLYYLSINCLYPVAS